MALTQTYVPEGGGGGGGSLDVKEEGVTVGTAVSAINFLGAGVTAGASVGGVVPVAIPGRASIWSIEAPPTSPSALDDEFSGGSLDAKWTGVGALTKTPVFRSGMLELAVTGTGAAFSTTGYEQVLPAGNFSVVAAVRCLGGQYTIGGLHLRNATTGAMKRFYLYQNSGSVNDIYIETATYSSLTARSSIAGATSLGRNHEILLRISYDGTNLYFDWGVYSWDGGVYWFALLQEAATTVFSAGLPNRVGLSIDPFGSGTFKTTYRFFRYYTTSRADTGNFT